MYVFRKRYPYNRPWRSLRLWGVEAPTFSLGNRLTDCGKFVSLTGRQPFNIPPPPNEYSWHSFLFVQYLTDLILTKLKTSTESLRIKEFFIGRVLSSWYNAVYAVASQPTFRRNMSPPSSASKAGGKQSSVYHLLSCWYTALYPRRK
jgi:hypothetical protein